ncbi:MAG: citramalate synthase [bacterium]|nr:citramalate synthase [bacterium]
MVELYDTTLRDGAQTEGISFSLLDKIAVALAIDRLGIRYIEGGWPGSNKKDDQFFSKIKKENLSAEIIAFGSTAHPKYSASDDPNISALLSAKTKIITIFGKTWDFQVKKALRISLDENLKLIDDSISYLVSKGKRVFFDAEHFFDGYKANPAYAKKAIETAVNAGASVIILCDTNGGTLPHQIEEIISGLKAGYPLGIHSHNDSELACANTLAGIRAGCTQVQGTINGYGERCGNANLCSIIPLLKLKLGMDVVSDDRLKSLTEVSRLISEIANIAPRPFQPYVGSSVFAHKAGIHASAVTKEPATYEHIKPEDVGNTRRILISELAGSSSILHKAGELKIDLSKDSKETKRIINEIKRLENEGYHFESAEASFELLIDKALGLYKSPFTLKSFRVIVRKEEGRLISEAVVKVCTEKEESYTVAEGDGPVNALDSAIRKALEKHYPEITGMQLIDYKVRVLDAKKGTAARVRVLIESKDREGHFGTVGVSENIIEASCEAMLDAIEYFLLKRR